MKLTVKQWLIAFLSAVFLTAAIWAVVPVIASSADEGDITCATASGNYLDANYLSVYRIPADMMTYEANGGAQNGTPVSNAFDGNWNSYWQTGTENKGQGSANPEFLNAITVTFSSAVEIQSIVYASSDARLGHGYPTILNVYTANGGELSLYGTCNSTATSDRVVFSLNEAVTVTQVKFEFRQVNTMHNWTATAKEICFLQPDSQSANKVLDLFGDYAQYTVKDEYKTNLSEIREDVSSLISYESALKPLLDRAEAIVSGHLKKDVRREFSTDPDSANVINRYGNLRSYAGGTLKMSSFGINRQVLGVGGLRGDTITIYVEAGEGDPLPSVAFNQIYGDWRSWQSTYSLSSGKNVFTFPNFITDNYSVATTAGGAIHVINPYEPSQQSSNVKIYVEGGFLYPVFRKGDDVTSYLADLTSYYNEMQSTEGMCNITELVGDHFIHTASASTAYRDYVTRTVNPQKSAEGWDNYISALMEFGGVSLNPEDEHFNEKNLHLYTNFRMVQPWAGAGAFAAGDHIGFITFGGDSMTNFGSLGWGIAHEIGHALDVNGRTIGETTNNMWSKFALAYFEHNVSRNFNAQMTNVLTPDETALSAGYFNTNTYSYQIWWNLEACHHGFWGRLDNLYRYYDEAAARTAADVTAADGQLSTTERMVYFSSLAVGEDLGYYYERYGFSFSTGDNYNPFRLETASSAYKKLIEKALDDEVIKERGFKYWYVDADQYFYDFSGDDYYTPSNTVEIRDVWKTSSGYTLLLTAPEEQAPHLGYEIMEYGNGNWYVIGFTYSGSFTDTTEYSDGYVPQYKIRAYDREMSASAESEAVSYEPVVQSNVCRIGETYYNSLSEAVASASANATIYVCADLSDGAITIDKNLTILPDPTISESVVIKKSAAGVMFTVNSGVTFTIGGNDGAAIVLDGNSFSQNGALIRVNGGTLRVYNAELRNNNNTDHGGAVYNTGNSAFTNVTFKNNVTSINGGAIANFSGGVVTLTDCTLTGNVAKGNGGALTLDGKTSLIRTSVTGNTAAGIGGAIYISCNNDARSISAEDGEIIGNTAGGSGSLLYLDKGILTLGGASAVQLSGEIYKNNGTINVSTSAPDLSDVTFRTATSSAGTALLKATGNLTFTGEYLESVKVNSAVAYFDDANKTVLIKPLTATVTLSVNGTDVTKEVALGNFVLPQTAEGIGEDKYISVWKLNGAQYSAGETVLIDGDCTFTAELGTKYTVTLKYDDENTQTYYVKPNDKFYPPVDCEFEQYSIMGWQVVGGDWYAPFAGIAITSDTVIEADTVRLFKVTLNGEDEQTVYCSYSTPINFGTCDAPEGKAFSHWEVNGVTYKVGDTVRVTGDTVIKPIFEDLPAEDGDDENNESQIPSDDEGEENDGSQTSSNDGAETDNGSQTPSDTDGEEDGGSQISPDTDGGKDGKPDIWVVALIVAIVLLAAAGVAVAVIFIRKHKNADDEYDEEYEDDYEDGEEYDGK